MTGTRRERARTFLAYGFAISIAVHLIVLPFVHREHTVTAFEPPFRRVSISAIPTPPPTPPPTPTPRPTAPLTPPPHVATQPPAVHRARPIRIHAPHAVAHAGGASEPANTHTVGDVRDGVPNARSPLPGPGAAEIGPSAAPAAATPSPRPTPTPLSCARPNVPATTLRAAEPELPPLAQGVSGTVGVVVSLDAQSHIVATRVQSSPSALLNSAALAAARGSVFRTEVRNCEPIAADYLFSVEFTSQ